MGSLLGVKQMKYTIENISAYLEDEERKYDIHNPLHITFACRTQDGRKATKRVFETWCYLVSENRDKEWISVDDYLEARLKKRRDGDYIEVREKPSNGQYEKGSILKVPTILFNLDLIDRGEKNDFDLLLSISKTLRLALPDYLEVQLKLAS
jgi:hypothetical protein